MNGRKQGNARNLRGISPGQPAIDLPGSRVALGRRPGNVLCVEYLHIIAAVTAALTLFLGSLYCWSLCMFDYCCRGQCRPIRCSPQAHKRWATPGGTGGPWGSPSPPPPPTHAWKEVVKFVTQSMPQATRMHKSSTPINSTHTHAPTSSLRQQLHCPAGAGCCGAS